MTPQEKAEELVSRYNLMQTYIEDFSLEDAKHCAWITAEEVMICDWFIETKSNQIEWTKYWQEVKQEIKKL